MPNHGLEGPDAYGNYPARAASGRAYPRSPVERGAWQDGESYAPGDVVDLDGRFLCVAAHDASAERAPGNGSYWEVYRGEVNYSAYWDPEHAVMIWPTG